MSIIFEKYILNGSEYCILKTCLTGAAWKAACLQIQLSKYHEQWAVSLNLNPKVS